MGGQPEEAHRRGGSTHVPAPGASWPGPGGDVVAPLTSERVARALTELGYPMFRDADGELGAMWTQAVFHVYLLGPDRTVLQVRTTWHRRMALERLPAVLELLDGWNSEYIGPKTYVRVLDDGLLSVVAESSVPLATGVSDTQLARLLTRGIGQGVRVLRDLEARYPDPVARPEAP